MMTRTFLQDTRPLALGVLAISVLVVGLIGCGSSSRASGSATAAVSAAAASPAASGGSPSSSAGREASAAGAAARPIDVCAILPAVSAAKLSGQGFTKANPRTGLQPQEYGCAYGNDDDSLQMEVTVFEHNAASSYDFFVSGSKNTSTVSNLGDKAFFDNDGTMYVLAGSNLIQVNGLKTAEQCAALARPVLAAL
jgi:hypothetical protein